VWKIIINKTTELCLNCILVISNRNSFRVLFDKITERYNYLYFSIGNGQPREPALCHLYCTIGIRFCSVPLRATLIFHLVDGLLSTTAALEVRRAGVLACGSCRLERSARPHPHRGRSCQVPKTAEIILF